ncbi:hypothetical protein [Pedobacter sp. ASV28]|jgi:hypothetical protein|uniref:hypothetical protein n=1 Tax=Pedobacter sp. ASV28 TaxID=2795123 RepID=UPI0018ED8F95|nr:hypothetical protein [Pedobacter sp. ASV28]
MEKKNRYNTEIINKLIKQYGCSRRFITQSLSGERVSLTSDSIKKDYKTLAKKVETALQ